MMTAVRDDRLLHALQTTTSATTTLAAHVGVPFLELDRQHVHPRHRITDRERALLNPHPGVYYAHHRDGFLRTPRPSWRPVAWVSATVLTGALPAGVAQRIVDGREPLGPLLIGAGAVRASLWARHESREDFSGEKVFMVSESRWTLDGLSVAVAREEVYSWVAR